MGTCLALVVGAWTFVRLWSVPLAVGMSIVAAVLPPIASVVANWGTLRGVPLGFDVPPDPGAGPAVGGAVAEDDPDRRPVGDPRDPRYDAWPPRGDVA